MSTVNVSFIKAGKHCCSSVPVEIPEELSIQDGAGPPSGCGMLRVLTANDGDKRVVWNRFIMAEIRAAKQLFLDLIKKGLVPYRVGTKGKPTSEIISEFDPNAEEIVFLPTNVAVGG